ncbi:MAG: TraB/GumN family protein, partial [Pseudomonadota bacterium]
MLKNKLKTGLLLGLLLCGTVPAALAVDSASVEFLPIATSAHSRPADARRQGALFRVRRDGQVGYLFGTIHVGAKSFYPLAPEVSQALADADTLVLELDTRADDAFQKALARHGSYRQGDHVAQHIGADTLARLTSALHALGITLASVGHLKPWLLANMLMALELERHGFERAHGNEFFLLDDAQSRGTRVAELESADYQLSLFDTLSDADAERYLRESLADLADGTSLRRAKATIAAWNSGDVAALDALIPEAVKGGSVMASFTRSMLLGKRNPEMAARIESLMQGNKTTFVAPRYTQLDSKPISRRVLI